MGNAAAGGGRWVEVAPERFPGWVASFAERHGETAAAADEAVLVLTAADGTVAECHVPFPPMRRETDTLSEAGPETTGTLAQDVAAHATAARTVGVLLVRLGGHAAGVFAGAPPKLIASKTGSRLVHGRTAAGGWSQHRFARRREKQVAEALNAAAEAAVRVFAPHRAELDAVVLGGDKRGFAGLRGDPRLKPYLAMAAGPFLTVPDPRLAVLRDSPALFRAIRIRLTERPAAESAPPAAPGTAPGFR